MRFFGIPCSRSLCTLTFDIGLLALVTFSSVFMKLDDAETIFILLSQVLFSPLISCFLLALVAIYLAYDRNSSIISLVSNAWAGFGAAFGPVVIGIVLEKND